MFHGCRVGYMLTDYSWFIIVCKYMDILFKKQELQAHSPLFLFEKVLFSFGTGELGYRSFKISLTLGA